MHSASGGSTSGGRKKEPSWRRKTNLAIAQKFKCYYCGSRVNNIKNSNLELTIDHKIPTSCGGSNKKENLVASCRRCNMDKSNLDEKEYALEKLFEACAHDRPEICEFGPLDDAEFEFLDLLTKSRGWTLLLKFKKLYG